MLQVGNLRISLLRAGIHWWDGGCFFGVVPKILWNLFAPADELNRIPVGFNCYLVETPTQRILIETGGGERHDERSRERMKLPPGSGVIPVDPATIDIVINSHLHWDHCGGNTVDAGDASFPNAHYFAQQGEYDHAMERLPRDAVSYRDINYQPLLDTGRMTLLPGNAPITNEVEMLVTPGHNRDMAIILARSEGETFCFLSDLIPTSANLSPTWVAAFDLYPLATIENKQRLLEQAVRENWWCAFSHDPNIAFARFAQDSKGRFHIHEQLA